VLILHQITTTVSHIEIKFKEIHSRALESDLSKEGDKGGKGDHTFINKIQRNKLSRLS